MMWVNNERALHRSPHSTAPLRVRHRGIGASGEVGTDACVPQENPSANPTRVILVALLDDGGRGERSRHIRPRYSCVHLCIELLLRGGGFPEYGMAAFGMRHGMVVTLE
jgi:hypothetical protein